MLALGALELLGPLLCERSSTGGLMVRCCAPKDNLCWLLLLMLFQAGIEAGGEAPVDDATEAMLGAATLGVLQPPRTRGVEGVPGLTAYEA